MNLRGCSLLVAAPALFGALTLCQKLSTESTAQPAQPSGQSKYQISSNLVVLGFVVTDKNGSIASGPSKEDFRIYEDDVLKTVHSFEHYRPSSPSSRPSIHLTAELDRISPDAPVSIIVLDETTTSVEDRSFARYLLKHYLASESEMMQQPTMLVAAGRRHFQVLCDYTTSKREVFSALDRYHPANDAWQRYSQGAEGDTYDAAFAWLIEVAEATAGHHGHKNMIWIGRGFPNLKDPTFLKDPTGRAGESKPAMTSAQRADLNSAFAICTNALRGSHITLYAVDTVGVSDAPLDMNLRDSENGEVFGEQKEFDSIAMLTGGKALQGRNDVDPLIQKSAEGGANFYSLPYVPTQTSNVEKEFRQIRIVMNDPNLREGKRRGCQDRSGALTARK